MARTKQQPEIQEEIVQARTIRRRVVRQQPVQTVEQQIQVQEQVQINYLKKSSNKKMSKITSLVKKPAGILFILLLIAIGGFSYYFYKYNVVSKNAVVDSQQKAEEAKKKTDEVVNMVSKLMVVKDSTNAVLATIADKSKLEGQKFFESAENGDDLILFPNMQKAVIYRPSINKIIDIGPFNPNAQASTSTAPAVVKSEATTSKAASQSQ